MDKKKDKKKDKKGRKRDGKGTEKGYKDTTALKASGIWRGGASRILSRFIVRTAVADILLMHQYTSCAPGTVVLALLASEDVFFAWDSSACLLCTRYMSVTLSQPISLPIGHVDD